MATSLIALGSNLGERETTLRSAIQAIAAAPEVEHVSSSDWHSTQPIGCSGEQAEFLNGAAVIRTARSPDEIHRLLRQIETDHGRQRRTRWDQRTLDLDLLLVDDQVIDSPSLVVPHPRMSFRRFVLEPAAEVAGGWVHPTIGWTVDQLRRHLDTGADFLAIVSPSEPQRSELVARLIDRYASPSEFEPDEATYGAAWPAAQTSWIKIGSGEDSNKAAIAPKLTIVIDPPSDAAATTADDADWVATAQLSGRGPTLRIAISDWEVAMQDATAAIESVWPALSARGKEPLE